MRRTFAFRALLFTSLLTAACDDDGPAGSTGQFATDHVLVQGTVLTSEGEPVTRAFVTIRVYETGCLGTWQTLLSAIRPDADGHYAERISVFSPGPDRSFRGCIEVEVQPFMSTGLEAGSARLDGVGFVRAGVPPPTVEIDIRLP
jgi:hypothetical protein